MAYPGGKNGAGVYQTIINRMPPHAVYIEPFLGGGAILRLKRPAAVNIGLDLDAGAIREFRKSFRADTKPARAGDLARGPEYRIEQGDAFEFLAGYPWTGGELVYADPPYMHATRSRRDLYRCELLDGQHLELVSLLLRLPCLVMVSGYWSELYGRTFSNWHAFSYQAVNRAGKLATEWIWSNFPEPLELHDYRYLGSNFREREKIKRQKTRWVRRLERMNLLQRRAMLWAIGDIWLPGSPESVLLNPTAKAKIIRESDDTDYYASMGGGIDEL